MISEQTEKDITVAIEKSYRIGYRAGIEKMRDAAYDAWARSYREACPDAILDAAEKLLKEAEDDL